MKKRAITVKRAVLLAVSLVLLLTATCIGVVGSWRAEPFQYFVESEEERTVLIDQLESKLEEMEQEANGPASHVHDADLLWPLETTRIVLSLNRYIAEQEHFPPSVEAIATEGGLSDLAAKYEVRTTESGWRLSRSAGVIVAEGN